MARDKLVYCRTCGKQIASSAKRCPNCGAKQKKGHPFGRFLLFLLLILIIFVLLNGKSGGLENLKQSVSNVQSSINNISEIVKNENKSTSSEKETVLASTSSVKESSVSSSSIKELPATSISSTVSETAGSVLAASGTNEEFRAFMDSYEAFMNEYCDFMMEYDENSSSASALLKYTEIMAKYADFALKADAINEDELSAEDYKYYIDVMARIEKRMIDVAGT